MCETVGGEALEPFVCCLSASIGVHFLSVVVNVRFKM